MSSCCNDLDIFPIKQKKLREKEENRGPTGPAGPQGKRGKAGPTGPSGGGSGSDNYFGLAKEGGVAQNIPKNTVVDISWDSTTASSSNWGIVTPQTTFTVPETGVYNISFETGIDYEINAITGADISRTISAFIVTSNGTFTSLDTLNSLQLEALRDYTSFISVQQMVSLTALDTIKFSVSINIGLVEFVSSTLNLTDTKASLHRIS